MTPDEIAKHVSHYRYRIFWSCVTDANSDIMSHRGKTGSNTQFVLDVWNGVHQVMGRQRNHLRGGLRTWPFD